MFSKNEVKKQQVEVVFLIFPKYSEICGLKNVLLRFFVIVKLKLNIFQSGSN